MSMIERGMEIEAHDTRSTSEKLEFLKKGTHKIHEIVLTYDGGCWLTSVWLKNNMLTHHRYGPGGRGEGVSYDYTPSFKIWKSRHKDQYHVIAGGSSGWKRDKRYKEFEEKPKESLFNLYSFIQKHNPGQIIQFSIYEIEIYGDTNDDIPF